MIAEPINDVSCLSKVTDLAAAAAEGNAVRNTAARFDSTRALAAWIRTLPQRNDLGEPNDGPKVACDVPQRVRIPADNPNCVERSALFLAAGELIDPTAIRQLATIETPIGRHTFPVEDDRPVKLDPRVPRNALEAGLFRMTDPDSYEMSPAEAFRWISTIAAEPGAQYRNGPARIGNAHRAFHRLLMKRPLPRNGLDDMTWALSVAEQAAHMFGVRGMEIVRLGASALQHALRPTSSPAPRNLSIRVGGFDISPDLGTLGSLARVGNRIGWRIGAAALQAKLSQLGIGQPVIREVERELNREGLSLGALGKAPPMPGTLAALTTGAIVKQRAAGAVT